MATGLMGLSSCAGLTGSGKAQAGDLSMVGVGEPQAGRGIAKLLDDYGAASGHPKVKYQYFPSEQFVALFSTALKSPTPPSAIWLNGQDIRKYALSNILEPLTPDYTNRFFDLGPKTFTVDGKLYGVPLGGTGGFMVLYNQDLLDKIGAPYPKTYEDLKSVSTELKKIGVAAFTHPGKTVYLWPVWFFSTYAQTTGNKPVEATMSLLKGQGKWTDDTVVEALDLLFAFHRDQIFAEDIFGLDATGSQANFERSKAAFWLGGNLNDVLRDKPEKVTPALQLPPMVVKTSGVVSQFPGGPGSPLCVNAAATDEQKQQTLDLMNFLSSDASCTYLTQNADGAFASNRKSEGSTQPAAMAAKGYIDQMFVYLDWYWPPEITAAFQSGIQAGMTGSKSATQVAAGIQQKWETLLKKGYVFK